MSQTSVRRRRRGARKLQEAMEILRVMGFGPKQSNETAGYVLLSLLDLGPSDSWTRAEGPLRGITPIIEFIDTAYRLGLIAEMPTEPTRQSAQADWTPDDAEKADGKDRPGFRVDNSRGTSTPVESAARREPTGFDSSMPGVFSCGICSRH